MLLEGASSENWNARERARRDPIIVFVYWSGGDVMQIEPAQSARISISISHEHSIAGPNNIAYSKRD